MLHTSWCVVFIRRMIVKIPVEIVELDELSFHLFVDGYINGQPCTLIIDTGASKTVFALDHIQSILTEIPVAQPEIQSTGITAYTLESHTGIINEFKLGNLLVQQMEILLVDLTRINEMYRKVTDRSIWGLIGSDFLLEYKAKLDYGNRTLSLRVPKKNCILKV